MIIDQMLVFDQGTYSTTTGMSGVNQFASGATTTSTNTINLLNARDIGAGGVNDSADLTVEWLITTAYTGGTSVNFQILGSTNNAAWTVYAETGAVPIANLTVGARLKLRMPIVNPDGGPAPQYLQLNYVNVGANTAGAVMAWLGSVDNNRSYPPGIVVNN
ncbi:hypothetical protein P3T24_004391 [Paraburkholderia sp. GAS33]|uniref:Bbp16 family capsid cement protein n=1 Tax=Paraburkholderia sp. GAS33 TaxID=3035130 RepID=UPI003D20E33E